ncbi:isochorismatase family hydrolase, putative [Talaromyces stipitatus ATCC 10500]|uniref:Isochorismatase family hydrolase, putative n=1 Tax=Talaromyces stipitatus (strain ATCC 10500 / CBS 375.48 / QM 6759 / NRRL 1006) TaxID=441959 RepID=B8M2J3_TALSN|nr:isochorismatase family hydrolase, putative [Talaromyces stipitatus ATCC 10500]EED21904.1 isochorismatase family hydrolase, putative [Talaromyces stipitatus ATCC 10500]
MATDTPDLNLDAPSDLQDIPDTEMQLLPPPEATYPDKASLLAAVHAHGKVHGYRVVVKSSSTPNDKKPGRTSKVWLRCDRGGQYRPRNGLTEETRKRRRTSRLTDCPFSLLAAGTPGFWTLTVTDPAHNHGPVIERARPVIQKFKKGQIAAQPYDWPHDATFTPFTTALVIIDMQKDFCAPGGYLEYQGYDISPTRAIIPRLQNLLQNFRAAGFPIYHTREGHRPDLSTLSSRENHRSRNNPSALGIGSQGPLGRLLIRGEVGHDTIDELYPLPDEPVIDKPGRGAFAHTDFELLLRNKGVKNLLLTGVTTDVCISTTMREANDRGFDCVVVEDACAATEPSLHTSTLDSIKMEGGIFGAVTSSADVIQALENFKSVTVKKLAPQMAAQMGT